MSDMKAYEAVKQDLLREIKEVVDADFKEWDGDYLTWVELITTDPPDRLSEIFLRADDFGLEFCDKVYETVKDAIQAITAEMKH